MALQVQAALRKLPFPSPVSPPRITLSNSNPWQSSFLLRPWSMPHSNSDPCKPETWPFLRYFTVAALTWDLVCLFLFLGLPTNKIIAFSHFSVSPSDNQMVSVKLENYATMSVTIGLVGLAWSGVHYEAIYIKWSRVCVASLSNLVPFSWVCHMVNRRADSHFTSLFSFPKAMMLICWSTLTMSGWEDPRRVTPRPLQQPTMPTLVGSFL